MIYQKVCSGAGGKQGVGNAFGSAGKASLQHVAPRLNGKIVALECVQGSDACFLKIFLGNLAAGDHTAADAIDGISADAPFLGGALHCEASHVVECQKQTLVSPSQSIPSRISGVTIAR